MKKTMICTAAFAFLFSLGMVGVSLAADPGPADITLKTEAGKKPAVFPHKKHQDTMKGECDTCHKAANFTPKAWTMKSGHDFCKGCHTAGVNGKTGPNKCPDCHK